MLKRGEQCNFIFLQQHFYGIYYYCSLEILGKEFGQAMRNGGVGYGRWALHLELLKDPPGAPQCPVPHPLSHFRRTGSSTGIVKVFIDVMGLVTRKNPKRKWDQQ
jgi:hypothetical protein